MNSTCGCCEGVEQLTPVPTANRPGLPALSYRVGTHATFLETMKARLSNLHLEIPDESRNEQGRPQFSRIYPLHDLKTRSPDDPAIALLDSWALVADVLTFYQERIANEGYLRTATERRSILELARLVGYKLRPGVASTVYLAYTLDQPFAIPALPGSGTATAASDPLVTIPAGSRAQSVPGPDELPQSFETADKLNARSLWNNLQVRLTQPQNIGANPVTIYFKGISANLKPNDPLLIVASAPQLYRIMEVTLDPSADRTKVTIQPWSAPATVAPAAAAPMAGREPRPLVDAVHDIVTRFRNAEQFGVSPRSRATREVLDHLGQLQTKLRRTTNVEKLKTALEQDSLPKLKEQHRAAVEGRFNRVEPWVRSLVAELEAAIADAASASPDAGNSPRAAAAAGAGNAGKMPNVTHLSDVFTSLIKPPSLPPSHSSRLTRSVGQSFEGKSDIAAQLLTSFRPEAASILYQAWQNVPVTQEPAVEVYALRTKAGVFGNNAPLEPVKRSDGIIIGSKEWDLKKSGARTTESFEIRVAIKKLDQVNGGPTLEIQSTIRVGSHSTGREELKEDDRVIIDFAAAKDQVIATVRTEENQVDVEFRFQKRPLIVRVVANLKTGEVQTSSEASDPTTVINKKLESRDLARDVIVKGNIEWPSDFIPTEEAKIVWLDAPYDQILPQTAGASSWVVLDRPNDGQNAGGEIIPKLVIRQVQDVSARSRAEYSLTAKTARLQLDKEWINPDADTFAVIRGTTVFAQSEKLELAEEPIKKPVCGANIELDRLYDGLKSGRWLIVSGERADITPEKKVESTAGAGPTNDAVSGNPSPIQVKGVPASELVMLAGVEQSYNFEGELPGDKTHSRLLLAVPLKYCYRRDTVIIYGNVVKATHGETRNEVLGSGDGSKALQQFALRQPPLTFVSAANPAGVDSTLVVRVNDVEWHETDRFADLLPNDRKFITKTDDDGKTTVAFGNGQQGARLPTGQENVQAVYRNGIGKPGNVKADQITQLATRPLGVKVVTNPLRASGGADKESRDQARQNAPLAVAALDRLVSTQDYADFARTFAGIGKASAAWLPDGYRQLVHVTIAGADDIPIEETSDPYRNLFKALHDFGDPYLPIQVEVRRLLLLVIQARVRVLPDYLWEKVEPKVRAALLEKFSFANRELGQDALLSEAISAIHTVEGVQFVDVDKFDGVDEQQVVEALAGDATKNLAQLIKLKKRVTANLAENETGPDKSIRAAELACFSPDVPDTIILSPYE
jgi:predicted phage baseplate assembly protein